MEAETFLVTQLLLRQQLIKEQPMKDSTKDKVQGTAHKVKGAVKEKLGRLTNDPNLEDQGTSEKIGGKIQKKIGDIEKVFEK
jgi:uncharacterized protein YjbJ (UPF0337 family)